MRALATAALAPIELIKRKIERTRMKKQSAVSSFLLERAAELDKQISLTEHLHGKRLALADFEGKVLCACYQSHGIWARHPTVKDAVEFFKEKLGEAECGSHPAVHGDENWLNAFVHARDFLKRRVDALQKEPKEKKYQLNDAEFYASLLVADKTRRLMLGKSYGQYAQHLLMAEPELLFEVRKFFIGKRYEKYERATLDL